MIAYNENMKQKCLGAEAKLLSLEEKAAPLQGLPDRVWFL